MIQYAGWSDAAISPQNNLDYYQAVTAAMGGENKTRNFYRLFMVPGMAHCGGGPGPNAFGQGANGPNPSSPKGDILSALEAWVERGVAPDLIIATKYVDDDPEKGVAFQRPLCPHPEVATFKGTGDPTRASSFACVRPDSETADLSSKRAVNDD
jgi:feruloyl esterase